MLSLRRIVAGVCGLAVLSCLLACGISGKMQQAAQQAQTSLELSQLGMSYHNYANSNKNKGPASSAEWVKWAQKSEPQSVALIQQTGPGGKYTFYWNVEIGKLPSGSQSTVLGYESKVPSSGGIVVMADGFTTKPMTAAEFSSATKPPSAGK